MTRLSAPERFIVPGTPAVFESHGYLLRAAVALSILIAAALGCTSPKSSRVVLADGTVINIGSDSTMTLDRDFPASRIVDVAGEALIECPEQPTGLIVKTPLLTLQVKGPARIHVESRRTEDWAQVHVLSGSATVEKRYKSVPSHAESLVAGDMVMLNSSVDLFEKEQFDLNGALPWPVLK